jgi:hypothetical protein
MSTFNQPSRALAGTLTKVEHINDLSDAVTTAFELLPDEFLLAIGKVFYGTDTGTANNYIVTTPYTTVTLYDGQPIEFTPLFDNTGVSTINVNGLGVKSIKLGSGSDVAAGDIKAGLPCLLRYSSSTGAFHLVSAFNAVNSAADSAAAAAASAAVAAGTAAFTDNNQIVKNYTDNTKQLKFSLSNLTTATTRTLTLSDKSGTIQLDSDIVPKQTVERAVRRARLATFA